MFFRRSCYLILVFGGCLLQAPRLEAEPRSVHSQNIAPREHHLFVGAELLLRQNNELVPVRRIKGNDALLANPIDDYVSIHNSDGLIWRMTTKVASTSATIDDLKTDRSSSAAMAAFADQARLQATMDDQANLIEQSQGELSRQAVQASTLANSDNPAERALGESQLSSIQTEMSSLDADLANVTEIIDSSIIDGSSEFDDEYKPDTLELSFRVSSQFEIPEAYVFIAIRVWANDRYFDRNFHRHVNNIGPKARKVAITDRGYPPGFQIKETKVYLFSYGEEIPTNLSEKHYPLSYEEAREFLNLSHLGEHRRETVPAEPAWSVAPPALLQHRDPQTLDVPVTVDLDEKGALIAIRDSGQIVTEPVRAIIQQLTFTPALENGTPVKSSLTVNLADFYKD